MSEVLCCTPISLPKDLQFAAALDAIQINPVNAPLFHTGLEKSALTLMTQKYWGSGGVDLSVQFMDNPTQACRSKILAHMNAWNEFCNVRFRETNGQGDVRIDRGPSGYWSYLGTDIRMIPKNQPTMNLQGFTENTSDSEYRRVVRHEVGHCFVGETLIDCPRDLKKYPLGIPIKDLVGKNPWVYAWKDGKLTIKKASRVWMSKKSAKVIRVKLKTGGPKQRKYLPPLELVGTPDHKILLSDGLTWKELGQLKPGDRLCSLYRQSNGQRSRIQWTGSSRIREHVFVCQEIYGERPENHDAHHKNENKLDQTPENLEWKDEFLHHSEHAKGKKRSPESIEKTAAFWRGRKHTDATRLKMSESGKNKPPMSEETRAKISMASKGRIPSEETLKKRSEAMILFYSKGNRSGMFGKKDSDETRAKKSASVKAAHARRMALSNHVVVSIEEVEELHDVFDMTVPGADNFVANGVVVHNSMGFPHEHQTAEVIAFLDQNKVLSYFMQTQGWSAAEVRAQVLTPLDKRTITGTTPDVKSIMCYQFPGSLTKNGQPIPGGTDFTSTDRDFARSIYPKATVHPVGTAFNKLTITVLPDGSISSVKE